MRLRLDLVLCAVLVATAGSEQVIAEVKENVTLLIETHNIQQAARVLGSVRRARCHPRPCRG